MATILFTWELGGGLGHISRFAPIAQGLVRRGHRVVAALRDLSWAEMILGDSGVPFLQAPVKTTRATNRIDPPSTFAHILHNTGCGDVAELRGLCSAWRTMFDSLRPDLMLCDHSPIALLAARGYRMRRVTFGTGFACPPDCFPLPDWRPWQKNDPRRLVQDELSVLGRINEVLHSFNQPALERVAQLFQEVDETLLMTFAELDHFPRRRVAEYWGVVSKNFGQSPRWPPGGEKRVFGYLKPWTGLPQLVGHLAQLNVSAFIYSPGVPPGLVRQFRQHAPNVTLAGEPIDLAEAGRQCDVALLNATHGTTAAMLLAGAPALLMPLNLEQRITGENVARLGAGLVIDPNNAKRIRPALDQLLSSNQFAESARRFANKCAEFNPQRQFEEIMTRLAGLLP